MMVGPEIDTQVCSLACGAVASHQGVTEIGRLRPFPPLHARGDPWIRIFPIEGPFLYRGVCVGESGMFMPFTLVSPLEAEPTVQTFRH